MKETLKQLGEDISDHYTLLFEKEGVTMSVEGDTQNCIAKFGTDLLEDHIFIKDHDELKSLFPANYITDFIGKGNSGISRFFKGKNPEMHTLEIGMGYNFPLRIIAENEDISISYLVAPRIESR